MPCKNKKAEDICGCTLQHSGVKNSSIFTVHEEEIDTKNLEENGRIQYFYHSPLCELPIRDVTNEQGEGYKTEPHIEIGVENYLNTCRQTNIVAFLNSKERYLFFVTCCRKEITPYYGKTYIVGYMIKEKKLNINSKEGAWYAVKGQTYIYSFINSISYEKIFGKRWTPLRRVDKEKTKQILDYFHEHTEIPIKDCVREIKRLDGILEENIQKKIPTRVGKIPTKEKHSCNVLREESCDFKNDGCLRWSINESNAIACWH